MLEPQTDSNFKINLDVPNYFTFAYVINFQPYLEIEIVFPLQIEARGFTSCVSHTGNRCICPVPVQKVYIYLQRAFYDVTHEYPIGSFLRFRRIWVLDMYTNNKIRNTFNVSHVQVVVKRKAFDACE